MCKNLTAISFIVLELWVTKVEKSDVCNRRVFANPVTYMFQYFYRVEIEVLNIEVRYFHHNNYHLLDLNVMPNKFGNLIHFNHCIFEKYQCIVSIFHLESKVNYNKSHLHIKRHQVQFTDCQFLQQKLLVILQNCLLIIVKGHSINVIIKGCIFRDNVSEVIHINNFLTKTSKFTSVHDRQLELPTLLISNTTFRNVTFLCNEELI